jgi:hypothetical protein
VYIDNANKNTIFTCLLRWGDLPLSRYPNTQDKTNVPQSHIFLHRFYIGKTLTTYGPITNGYYYLPMPRGNWRRLCLEARNGEHDIHHDHDD